MELKCTVIDQKNVPHTGALVNEQGYTVIGHHPVVFEIGRVLFAATLTDLSEFLRLLKKYGFNRIQELDPLVLWEMLVNTDGFRSTLKLRGVTNCGGHRLHIYPDNGAPEYLNFVKINTSDKELIDVRIPLRQLPRDDQRLNLLFDVQRHRTEQNCWHVTGSTIGRSRDIFSS